MSDELSEHATDPVRQRCPAVGVSGLLSDVSDRLLLVRTAEHSWELPGAPLTVDESPLAGCRRAIRDALGFETSPIRLLVRDASQEAAGSVVELVYDCGIVNPDQLQAIRRSADGLVAQWRLFEVTEIAHYLPPLRHASRIRAAIHAYDTNDFVNFDDAARVEQP